MKLTKDPDDMWQELENNSPSDSKPNLASTLLLYLFFFKRLKKTVTILHLLKTFMCIVKKKLHNWH